MDKVIVQQDREFRVSVSAQNEGDATPQEVAHLHELSPYTMMLVSLGTCTGIVLHICAQHHGIDLTLAETTATYHRNGHGADHNEWVEESLRFEGNVTERARERLERVAHHCSIRKMLESGIEVRSQ